MIDIMTILAEMFNVLSMITVSFAALITLSLFVHAEPNDKG